MPESADSIQFSLLPRGRAPLSEVALSTALHVLAFFALLLVGLLRPVIFEAPFHDYHFIHLVDVPPPVPHTPAPVRLVHTEAPVLEAPAPEPVSLQVKHDEIRQVHNELQAPSVVMAAEKIEMRPVQVAVPSTLRTNVFSTGSSAAPTTARPPQTVQTGGFGDPNGVPAKENHGKPVTIAALGSYDLPSGPGYGNGTGGAHGARGVVASTGFGNGVAIGDGTRASRPNVRQAGFSDAQAMTPAQANPSRPANSGDTRPVEIIAKPAPIYTDQARKLRIEGEVLLQVTFESSGKLHVLGVVRGLGHGLDESAIRAAEQIQFKPALRDGQPTDATAVVHVLFQLT